MNPFAKDPAKSIGQLGETALIARMRQWLGPASPPEPAGIGDDCAAFSPTGPDCQQLVTTDPILYGKHFDDDLTPEQAAAKLAKRNLSDIAAMGGKPTLATVSLALSPRVSISWMERFYRELGRNATQYRYVIAGGDISSADDFLGAFLTLLGETQPGVPPLLRHQAQPGSHLYVTGELGGSRAEKHHSFTPRLEEGQWLARSGNCLSCTDLSDGLGKDATSLLPPGTAAEMDCQTLPASRAAFNASEISGKSHLYHIFNDGEDFELYFATNPNTDPASLEAAWRKELNTSLTRIGRVVTSKDEKQVLLLNSEEGLDPHGYEHLRET